MKRLRTEMTEKSHERRAIIIGGRRGRSSAAVVGASIFMSARRSSLIGRGVGIFATHVELLEAMDKCGAGPSTLMSLFTSASPSTAEPTCFRVILSPL